MDQETVTHAIELIGGYTDNKKARNTRVVFGRRLIAKDLFTLEDDPQAKIPTQYSDLIIRAHITEFGTLKMPVPLTVLLSLDSIDREDLEQGCDAFRALLALPAELLSEHKWKLSQGFQINGLLYNRVEFGVRTTGADSVEADRLGLPEGLRRECFFIGKQIKKIAAVAVVDDKEVVTAELDGPVALKDFELLDGTEVTILRGAAELWRQSFRFRGARVSRNGGSADGAHSDDQNRPTGVSDSQLADRAA